MKIINNKPENHENMVRQKIEVYVNPKNSQGIDFNIYSFLDELVKCHGRIPLEGCTDDEYDVCHINLRKGAGYAFATTDRQKHYIKIEYDLENRFKPYSKFVHFTPDNPEDYVNIKEYTERM